MKYYEFLNPYYALIKGENAESAVREYIDNVAGEQREFESFLKGVKEVPEYYAAIRYSRCKGKDGVIVSLDELIESFESEESVLLVDGALV